MQIFARRKKFIKPGLEETKWKELSYHFMTEEKWWRKLWIIVEIRMWVSLHTLSPLMHKYICSKQNRIPTDAKKFMARLDRWCQQSQGKRENFREKSRVLGTPSSLPQQCGPKWVIRQEESDHNLSWESGVTSWWGRRFLRQYHI